MANMLETIDKPRADVSKCAQMATIKINPDKIREVIGTGGKTINNIIEKCDVAAKIDINDDGLCVIYHSDREIINKALAMIEELWLKQSK